MSNRRKRSIANTYRTEFLHSRAWFARRARWFRDECASGRELRCILCGAVERPSALELHHLAYTGVRKRDGRWRAGERHDDLVPLHAACHDLIHRLIDRDEVLAFHRDRRTASLIALTRLQRKLLDHTERP